MKVDLRLENKKTSKKISQKPSNVNIAYDAAPTILIKRSACSRRDSEAIAGNVDLFTLHQASHAQQRLATTTTVTLVPSVYPRSRTRKFEKRGYMAWLLN